jgi:hypothetical protein
MNRTFNSFGAAAQVLKDLQKHTPAAAMNGMRDAAAIVLAETRASLGTYQGAAGPFAGWAPLAASTQAERLRLGYPADEIFIRTRELQESYEIGEEPASLTVGVGSELPRALALEVGDPARNLPPRSILGRAFVVREAKSFNTMVATLWRELKAYL